MEITNAQALYDWNNKVFASIDIINAKFTSYLPRMHRETLLNVWQALCLLYDAENKCVTRNISLIDSICAASDLSVSDFDNEFVYFGLLRKVRDELMCREPTIRYTLPFA